jgi:hypothetical protein
VLAIHWTLKGDNLPSQGPQLPDRAHPLGLSEGVTGRIVDGLRRLSLQGIADKTQKVGFVLLQVFGAKMPSAVGQRE